MNGERQGIDAEVESPTPDAPAPIPAYILEAAEATYQIARLGGSGSAGRKFNPQVTVKLLQAIRAGNYYEPACRLAGVSYNAFKSWLDKADDDAPDGPYGTFAAAVKVAEAEAEAESVANVRAASTDPRFWAAGMTFLERRHRERWGRPEAGQLTVNVGVVLGVGESDDQRRGRLGSIDHVIAQVRLSPQPESLMALSPASEMAVSGDQGEAKATPIYPVSPSNVA